MYTKWYNTNWCTFSSLFVELYYFLLLLECLVHVVSGTNSTSPMSCTGSSVLLAGVMRAEGGVLPPLLVLLGALILLPFSGGIIIIPSGWKIFGEHDDIAPRATARPAMVTAFPNDWRLRNWRSSHRVSLSHFGQVPAQSPSWVHSVGL